MNGVIDYFKGDVMAANVWESKYAMKDEKDVQQESTPAEMHYRMAKEFSRIEYNYRNTEMTKYSLGNGQLSEFGFKLLNKRFHQTQQEILDEIFCYFDRFGQIVPQGSIMANLGNKYVFGSLSNCFGIAPPYDSYGGIMRTDEETVQLMKRRGGVGTPLHTLRYTQAYTSNAAKSSTGVPSFAQRFSNSTREVAQEGRRGALMLLLLVNHPDIFRFCGMKDDKTLVTGANVSPMLTDRFMQAVEHEADFYCRFPVDVSDEIIEELLNALGTDNLDKLFPYNQIKEIPLKDDEGNKLRFSLMRIKAVELFNFITEMAWKNGEPGAAFYDRVLDYSPDGVYEQYSPKVCNPCAEQWFSYDETCRLIVLNFLGVVDNPYTDEAYIDEQKLYEIAYIQQRLGDDLVDLEVEHIDKILGKLESDIQKEILRKEFTEEYLRELYSVEVNLWTRIKKKAIEGRRTGGGFTALGDMLAALNLPYHTQEGRGMVEKVLRIKMEAELDATIDMAILRGTFTGWDNTKEYDLWEWIDERTNKPAIKGKNSFFSMINSDFPHHAAKMYLNGRRNVNWSNVSPCGSLSVLTQTTSGLECLFKAFYIRRKKINANEAAERVDFVDQNGDKWQEFAVLHPQFKRWIELQDGFDIEGEYVTGSEAATNVETNTKMLNYIFELSPWYGSEANDIAVEDRIKMNEIIQKYTTNSLSCTINLPNDAPVESVRAIYSQAWKAGLKGITVYRDGCRSGVLVSEPIKEASLFEYTNSIKRPKVLNAQYHFVVSNGKKYGVIIGLLDGKPYELFAHENPAVDGPLEGEITKVSKGIYKFSSSSYTIDGLEVNFNKEEKLLTRMCSQLLRHGVDPRHIVRQVQKTELNIVSFAKAITRVLKKYVPQDNLVSNSGELCSNCGEAALVHQEGCVKCANCGTSKC